MIIQVSPLVKTIKNNKIKLKGVKQTENELHP